MEKWKIEDKVFDKKTLLAISKLFQKGLIKSVDFPISTGKEANVYRCSSDEGYKALKIYKIETSAFRDRQKYIRKKFRNIREEVYYLCRREFKNLVAIADEHIAPLPYYQHENIMLMEFLGKEGIPYPTADKTKINKEYAEQIIINLKKLYRKGIIHADLSQFNIIIAEKPYFIDFGQAVNIKDINAKEFFERDVRNIVNYLNKQGFNYNYKEVLEFIKK